VRKLFAALNDNRDSDFLFDPNASIEDIETYATKQGLTGEQLLRNLGNRAIAEVMGRGGKTPQTVDALLQSPEAKSAPSVVIARIKECETLLRNLYSKSLIGK
jgi:hypothetical protein